MNDDVVTIKNRLGNRVVIPAHHYELDEVVDMADFLGDSYKLAVDCSKTRAEYIVFGGVSFMAEGAALLAGSDQKVLIPDPQAGCPMAQMITGEGAKAVYETLSARCDRQIIPIVYMNSHADMKAFCGAHDGTVCTSSNASKIVKRFLDEDKSVFFSPDFNLGINTANDLGIPGHEVVTVRRDGTLEGADPSSARIFLWDGFCHVHKTFTLDDISRLRSSHPDIQIIVHPECEEAVVTASDYAGSTAMIYNTVKDAAPGTVWGIGTEYRFVARMANTFSDKTIIPLRESICHDMSRITLEKLTVSLASVESFIKDKGPLIHPVTVPESLKKDAKKALQRMIDIVEAS
ncbi:quinolinate synthetase [Desulfocicer vacuolatum DSM 3385]|uniref:Quinolinate synthase n=1 Tax=Desulfocicer vacuolatum DSM 3385 TaxID=1121400 RepID=A0A1W2AQR9_9BACT|nr:quinolinate synthase NadA [Desulfocicer vacuolatum]SMC63089.1 quinolinate synthetase [Desulfocicer vacuolatum DSM 3385]